jgi:hypothetical protein
MSPNDLMRTIPPAVLGLVAVVACAEPPPKLIKVSETEQAEIRFVTYADLATIKKNGSMVRMTSVIDPEVADDAAVTRRRFSWKDEWDYECQRSEFIPHRFTQYSGRMGTGEKMYSQSVPVIYWMPVVPGTLGDKLWRIACGKE